MIKRKIDRRLNTIFIPILVKYEMVNLLSLLLMFSLKEINNITPKVKPKYKVIVLNKSGGSDDLISSQKKYNKNITYLQSYRSFFKNIYYTIFEVKDKRIGNYPKENKIKKKKYLNFLIKFLKVLKEKYHINAFIGFNIGYYAERDLQKACDHSKIPFLLLFKESVLTEIEKKYFIYTLKKADQKFNGTKIAVYSNLAKELLTSSNYVHKNKIDIVGCSRLAESFSYKKIIPRKQILYYAIQNNRGLPHYFIKEFGNKFFKNLNCHQYYNSRYNWNDLHIETLKILKKFAKNNPKTLIIIKNKIGANSNQKDYLNLPKNIEVIFGGVGHQLLKNSKVVIGWNTTSIMESMAANRFILLPYFHVNKKDFNIDNELLLKLKKKNYGYSPNDFYNKLEYFVNLKYDKNKVYNNKYSLKYYLGDVDNHSNLKLNNFIKEYVAKS